MPGEIDKTGYRKKRTGHPGLPNSEKRSERIELRVTIAEKQQLEDLCQQGGNLTMTTLLLNSTLDSMAALPQFRQIPPAIAQQLAVLPQMAGRLFGYAHQFDSDERTQQQIRQLVYAIGHLDMTIRQHIELTALPRLLIEQLDRLRCLLSSQEIDPVSVEHTQPLLTLIDELLTGYRPNETR